MHDDSHVERLTAGLGIPNPLPIGAPRHPVPLPSRLAVGELAWAAVSVASLAAAQLAGSTAVDLDADRIAIAYASEQRLRIDGAHAPAFAPLSGFFRTADGWVRTHGNYPHHAAALRKALGLRDAAGRDDAASAFATRTTADVTTVVTGLGGLCVAVAPEDPLHDASLRNEPLVRTTRIDDAPPSPPRRGTPDAPLRGIRVLDLTRVVAGPVATRTLALLGADVLRIDPPRLPEIEGQHLDTGHGKRSALLDLTMDAARTRFDELLADADVVALGYRPASLDRLGLSPRAIAAKRPGVIVVQHSAWGDPRRRGFDSLVQAASGIAWIESPDGETPGALPAQALDHSTGYLLAAAAMALLSRRAREGGSWFAGTSLRRMAAELLGMPRTAAPEPSSPVADVSPHLQSFDVEGIALTTAAPAVAYSGGPAAFAPPRRWGRDEPAWSS